MLPELRRPNHPHNADSPRDRVSMACPCHEKVPAGGPWPCSPHGRPLPGRAGKEVAVRPILDYPAGPGELTVDPNPGTLLSGKSTLVRHDLPPESVGSPIRRNGRTDGISCRGPGQFGDHPEGRSRVCVEHAEPLERAAGHRLCKHPSRRGDSNPQPPVYKDYGSRPCRSGEVQPVLNCLIRQSDSSMAMRLGPGPPLADPLASGLMCRTGGTRLRALRVKVRRHPA